MSHYLAPKKPAVCEAGFISPVAGPLTVCPLTSEHESEVLAFLSTPAVHTVIMDSFIRDNGLDSPLNRGTFHACRDREGELKGVSLIGHLTLIEARSEAALREFALLLRKCPSAYAILDESRNIERFWRHYAPAGGQAPRRLCREILFEKRPPARIHELVRGLRRAVGEDLELVLPVHAQMALEESGVSPLEKDPEGFRLRTIRRIEQGRIWLLAEGGRLIFKADVVAETPAAVYLEGVYVNPGERSKGYGTRCLSQLARNLLESTNSICLLVNEQNTRSQDFYRRAGYEVRGRYDTVFLHTPQLH